MLSMCPCYLIHCDLKGRRNPRSALLRLINGPRAELVDRKTERNTNTLLSLADGGNDFAVSKKPCEESQCPCFNERVPCQEIDPYWSEDTEEHWCIPLSGDNDDEYTYKARHTETCLLYEFNVIDFIFTLTVIWMTTNAISPLMIESMIRQRMHWWINPANQVLAEFVDSSHVCSTIKLWTFPTCR